MSRTNFYVILLIVTVSLFVENLLRSTFQYHELVSLVVVVGIGAILSSIYNIVRRKDQHE